MVPSDLAGAAGALLAVLALVWLLRLGLRVLPNGVARRPPRTGDGLLLVEQLFLGERRRLSLVRCGGGHVLVLSGGTVDAMLPWPAPAGGTPS
ncbi:MAG: flagellar biosynthetic protein FliO [Gluconacetobacter diazotrophicus]|nr:flagellar biosynthetic protein FliO [Gluconacetobacter diazotrophicus]